MKTAFIFVLFKTPKSEINRLKKEVKDNFNISKNHHTIN